jgi:protein O-GlcNAc transferase
MLPRRRATGPAKFPMAKSVDQTFSEARAHAKRGELDKARQLYQQILDKYPNNKRAREALVDLDSASPNSSHKPPPPQDQIDTLIALHRQGELQQALTLAQTLAEVYRESVVVYNALGLTQSRLGQAGEAIASYKKALKIDPHYAGAYYNLGNELSTLGRRDEAIASYERALKINPHDAAAHNNLGVALEAIGRKDDAIARYKQALTLKPAYSDAYINLGNVLNALGRKDEAIACYEQVLAISPGEAKAFNNMGAALQDLGRRDEALACYEKALKFNPHYTDARAQKLVLLGELAEWESINAEAELSPAFGVEGDPVAPFGMLALEDHPAHHRKRAELYAQKHFQRPQLQPVPRPDVVPERLRIGYFSADFGDHAVMHLMARLFEVHDRKRFSLHAYSYGPNSGGPMRGRLEGAFDVFHDVRTMSDRQVAELARRDGVHIAVDLNGYTKGTRIGILAYRPAPVQMSYLGFPGTTGAPFIDYLIADQVVIPPEQRQHYAESVVFLPGSYQVNDNTRAISARAWTRAEAGLPENGFVFCCMNNVYKISSREFDIWMRLLHQVEGSVLWASKTNQRSVENLKKEAEKRGIDAGRIVFAEKVPDLADHLARLPLADLFLDTFTFNAHTTASDALWAGLPVLTNMGAGFAARVAGSLLTAIGLPELITHAPEAYEAKALDLALHPEKVSALKTKLLRHRDTAPLFNTELFAGHMEEAYQQAYRRYFDGKEPSDIVIAARP